MTKDEFEQQYAQRSGVTVDWLHSMGRYAAPCDCTEPECQGWQMEQVYITDAYLKTVLSPGRWGGNWQPELHQVIAILKELPVADVELLSPDRIRITTLRPLTFWESFIFGRLNPDEPPEGIGEEQTEFIFWWD